MCLHFTFNIYSAQNMYLRNVNMFVSMANIQHNQNRTFYNTYTTFTCATNAETLFLKHNSKSFKLYTKLLYNVFHI